MMKAHGYCKDSVTGKLVAFKFPEDWDLKTDCGEFIQAIKEEQNVSRAFVRIDCGRPVSNEEIGGA